MADTDNGIIYFRNMLQDQTEMLNNYIDKYVKILQLETEPTIPDSGMIFYDFFLINQLYVIKCL